MSLNLNGISHASCAILGYDVAKKKSKEGLKNA